MKKLFLTMFILFCSLGICFAGPITKTCKWQQEGIKADFGGWKLYYSETSGGPYTSLTTIPFVAAQTEYTQSVSLNMPSYEGTVKTLYFVLTAFNKITNLETAYSNEASAVCDFTNTFAAPINFTITINPNP
jgi:hypothetical protein